MRLHICSRSRRKTASTDVEFASRHRVAGSKVSMGIGMAMGVGVGLSVGVGVSVGMGIGTGYGSVSGYGFECGRRYGYGRGREYGRTLGGGVGEESGTVTFLKLGRYL